MKNDADNCQFSLLGTMASPASSGPAGRSAARAPLHRLRPLIAAVPARARIRHRSSPPPPPHQAPRGDMFRELAEQRWAALDHTAPTPDTVRAKRYEGLAESVDTSIYRRRRRLKGPVEKLRQAVGSNRYCEFGQWLERIRGLKGKSVPVRYHSLLSIIEQRITGLTIEFRYTYDDFDHPSLYTHTKTRLNEARDLLNKARQDTAELKPLLVATASLHRDLRYAKHAACLPPPAPVPEDERQAQLASEAQRKAQEARDARVAESRKWLRDLMSLQNATLTTCAAAADGSRWMPFSKCSETTCADTRACCLCGHRCRPSINSQPIIA